MSIAATNLLKETSRPSSSGYEFNYQLLSSAILDMVTLFNEAQKMVFKSSLSPAEDSLPIGERNLLLIIHSTILRIQRILTASLMKQIRYLLSFNKEYISTSIQEVEFVASMENSVNLLRNTFPSLDLFVHGCTISQGPRKLYSLIRVIEDCGTIQTEKGFLALKQDSLHFVRVEDIRHLILQKKLVVLE